MHLISLQRDVPRNDAVEGASEEMQRLAGGTGTALTGNERAKVFRSLWDNIGPERHLNAPKRSAVGGDLQATSNEGVNVSHRRISSRHLGKTFDKKRTSKKTTAGRRR